MHGRKNSPLFNSTPTNFQHHRQHDWDIFVNDFNTIFLKNGVAFYVGADVWSFDRDQHSEPPKKTTMMSQSIVYDPVQIELPNHRPIKNIKTSGGNVFLLDDQNTWFGYGYIFQQSYWEKSKLRNATIHELPSIEGKKVTDVLPEFNVFYKTESNKWYAEGSNYKGDMGLFKKGNLAYKLHLGKVHEAPDPKEIRLPWGHLLKRISNGHANNYFTDGKRWYGCGEEIHQQLKSCPLFDDRPFRIQFPKDKTIADIQGFKDIAIIKDETGQFYINDNNLYQPPESERVNKHFLKLNLPNNIPIAKIFCGSSSVYLLDQQGNCFQLGQLRFDHDNADIFDIMKPLEPGLTQIKLPNNEAIKTIYPAADHVVFQDAKNQLFGMGEAYFGVKVKEGHHQFTSLDPLMKTLERKYDETISKRQNENLTEQDIQRASLTM